MNNNNNNKVFLFIYHSLKATVEFRYTVSLLRPFIALPPDLDPRF